MSFRFLKYTKERYYRSGKTKFGFLESQVVGRDAALQGPFGKRRIVYCDYTASGRALRFVEDFILNSVLPYYANTHTEASTTGRCSGALRESARDEVRRFARVDQNYAVLFVGNGCTSAINRLFYALNIANRQDILLILGPYEHHATILPSITTSVDVKTVQLDSTGYVDIEHLKAILQEAVAAHKKPIGNHSPITLFKALSYSITGLFSAASNVTGTITETDDITKLLHEHNGWCFWDYASGAPYLEIKVVHKVPIYSKDAVFFSPHKFLGGISTPGILIAKRSLFENSVPGEVGGGSVAYVTRKGHAFKSGIEDREESGTPNIVGSIRAGLVLSLGSFLSQSKIEAMEIHLNNETINSLSEVPNLQILGNTDLKRLPIFSFIVKAPFGDNILHHHFICSLLNDLFGIQSRSGCMCSGPYSQTLLSISDKAAEGFFQFLELEGAPPGSVVEEVMKPGYVRLNLMYIMKNKDVSFILEAIKFVALHAWRFLPCYKCDTRSGYWTFESKTMISSFVQKHFQKNNLTLIQRNGRQKQCMDYAYHLAQKITQTLFHEYEIQKGDNLSPNARRKRWFVLSYEAFEKLPTK